MDKPSEKEEQQEPTEGGDGDEEKIKKAPTETSAGEDNKEMEEKMEAVKVESVEKLPETEVRPHKIFPSFALFFFSSLRSSTREMSFFFYQIIPRRSWSQFSFTIFSPKTSIMILHFWF